MVYYILQLHWAVHAFALDLEFSAGIGGFRAEVALDNYQVPLVFDSSSTVSFIYSDVGGTWETKNPLAVPIQFSYSGGHAVLTSSSVMRTLNDLNSRVERFYLGETKYVLYGVFGALSLNANSALGRIPFALLPSSTADGMNVLYTSNTDRFASVCAHKKTIRVPLREDILAKQYQFVIVTGSVATRGYKLTSQLLVATGKQGVELPVGVYTRYLDSLSADAGVRVPKPDDPSAEYIRGPAFLCEKDKRRPSVTVVIGQRKHSIMVELDFSDVSFAQNNACIIAITVSSDPTTTAIGSAVLEKLNTLVDPVRKSVSMCLP